MAKVIIFNGAPRSGKDALGSIIIKEYEAEHLQYKDALIDLTKRFYQVSDEAWDNMYKWDKDKVYSCFGIKSPRQALIHVSENVIKPVFGKRVFGEILAERLSRYSPDIYVVTDSGFKDELEPVIEQVGVENVLVIRLHREGCTYKGDSRGFIKDEWFKDLRIIDFVNDKPLKECAEELTQYIDLYMKSS